ncbi:MAG: hypothetical protein ACSHYC_05935, partial [Alphaproteobacteria bacterium]
PPANREIESDLRNYCNSDFFNKIGPLPTFVDYVLRCDAGGKCRLSLHPLSLRCIESPVCGQIDLSLSMPQCRLWEKRGPALGNYKPTPEPEPI